MSEKITSSNEMVLHTARIIDKHAFIGRYQLNKARRQEIAIRKATEILNGAAAHQIELVAALAQADRQLRVLLEVIDTLDTNFHKELDLT
jgi:hypothetical protein